MQPRTAGHIRKNDFDATAQERCQRQRFASVKIVVAAQIVDDTKSVQSV